MQSLIRFTAVCGSNVEDDPPLHGARLAVPQMWGTCVYAHLCLVMFGSPFVDLTARRMQSPQHPAGPPPRRKPAAESSHEGPSRPAPLTGCTCFRVAEGAVWAWLGAKVIAMFTEEELLLERLPSLPKHAPTGLLGGTREPLTPGAAEFS